jgi:hypothetical protein
MAIPIDKSRITVTLPDRIKSDFECICELDKRTSSKQLEYILEYYIQNIEKRLSIEDYDKYYHEIYLVNQLIEKIYYFCSRKTGEYMGRTITYEYFYEVFKNEVINDNIVKKVVELLTKSTIPNVEFFLECVKYYNNHKKD